MLEKLILDDFQPHEHLEVDLQHPIVCITGPNDAGKSSTLRALQWVIFNTPVKKLIRIGAHTARAELIFDGGRSVVREQGKNGNRYFLDGKEFKAFGQGVPPEIAQALNISTASFQQQHSALFWLSETAGEVSRQLNTILDMEVIDNVLAAAGSMLRDARKEETLIEGRLANARNARDAMVWVPAMAKELEAVEIAAEKAAQKRLRCDRLRDLLQKAAEAQETHQKALTASQAAQRVVVAGEMAIAHKQRASRLRSLLESLAAVKDIQVPDIGPLEAAKNRAIAARERANRLRGLLSNVKQTEIRADALATMSAKAQAEVAEAIGEQCPVCGQAVPNESKN